ncbi:tetratricopeptide repeat protein [Propionivibrio sp.]|uniref:tetratricopeptide repeat protein n=1 Tax=Propionivibrio sp. TaxID=2212460 RepID=UPI003BEF5688
MEALKKAEISKREKTKPSASQSSQPKVAETPNPATTPNSWPSLLPFDVAEELIDSICKTDTPAIAVTQKTIFTMPDLAPPPIEVKNFAAISVEPAPLELELEFDVQADPTPNAAPSDDPRPATSAMTGANSPLATHLEDHSKAQPQDDGRVAAAQQKAKKVFTAKQSVPDRLRTLVIAGSAASVLLALFGFGYYFWQIELFSSTVLPASTPLPIKAATPDVPADVGVPQPQNTSTVSQLPDMIGKPAPVAATVVSPPAAAFNESARSEPPREPNFFKENPAIQIRQNAPTNQLDPMLGKAYQSFLVGDVVAARQLYKQVLRQEPNNRDALLGMAAVALNQQQTGQALAWYGKLLELDPADPEALAALINLQGQTDPVQSESRLKKLLAQNPQADAAHFALGNLYMQQSRWAEAQQSYFRAYGCAPDNADYSFNLAVSLDHLNQGKLALDYYRRALAQPGPANFDKPSAQIRISELLQAAENQ